MDVADRERRLKLIYLDALPGRLHELERVGADISAPDPRAADALINLHRLVHNLAGSSATYGFESLGDKASELEDWLEIFIEQSTLPSDADKVHLSAFFDELIDISEQLKMAMAVPS